MPGPMCGWVGRILHPDSCISVSSWSTVSLLSIWSVAVPLCRPLCLVPVDDVVLFHSMVYCRCLLSAGSYVDWRKILDEFACQGHRSRSRLFFRRSRSCNKVMSCSIGVGEIPPLMDSLSSFMLILCFYHIKTGWRFGLVVTRWPRST